MSILPQPRKPYGVIYTITNRVNGKQYIGQTTRDVATRWLEHINASRAGKGCRILQSAIHKYGPNAFDVESIIACDSQEELDRTETMTIKAGGTLVPCGYNLQTGGSNGRHNLETRKKMSKTHKNKPVSPEHQAKLIAVTKSPERRAKVSAALKGKSKSPEHRAKISAALKGRPAWNKGRPAWNKGRPAWNRDKHPSQETRIRMSISQKARQSRERAQS